MEAAAAAEKVVPEKNSTAVEKESEKQQQQSGSKKRRRAGDDSAYRDAYQGFTYESIPSTGRPGTPHRFFAESYSVKGETTTGTMNASGMRVHQHANGLCVVTVGDAKSKNDNKQIISISDGDVATIQFHAKETPEMSTAAKRKRAGAMLKGKQSSKDENNIGVVRPNDLLLSVGVDGEHNSSFPCCVFGSLLELNQNLTAELLQKDPLLKGYLAVILPAGPFPPPPINAATEADKPP